MYVKYVCMYVSTYACNTYCTFTIYMGIHKHIHIYIIHAYTHTQLDMKKRVLKANGKIVATNLPSVVYPAITAKHPTEVYLSFQ